MLGFFFENINLDNKPTTTPMVVIRLLISVFSPLLFAGLSAELYYVRDGQVNEYAMHFVVPVPANVSDIAFTWQSLAGRPVSEDYICIVFILLS